MTLEVVQITFYFLGSVFIIFWFVFLVLMLILFFRMARALEDVKLSVEKMKLDIEQKVDRVVNVQAGNILGSIGSGMLTFAGNIVRDKMKKKK